MKMQEQTEILKHFDDIFETDTLKHIDFGNMKLLKALFNNFEEDLYTPSIKYERLRTKQIRISDKLESTFTQEQQELFEKYWEVTSEMSLEEDEQLFLFGFIIAKKLDKEAEIKKENE